MTIIKAIRKEDVLISEKLSESQRDWIKARLKADVDASKMEIGEINSLLAEVEFAILSPRYFKNAGNDFLKKANTILKIIREGRWSTPAGMLVEKKCSVKKTSEKTIQEKSDADDEMDAMRRKHQELFEEMNVWRRFYSHALDTKNQNEINRTYEELMNAKAEFDAFTAKINEKNNNGDRYVEITEKARRIDLDRGGNTSGCSGVL